MATYTIVGTAAQDVVVTRQRNRHNVGVAIGLGLPASATQADVLAVYPAADWHADNTAYIKSILKNVFVTWIGTQQREDAQSFETYWAGLTPAQKAANIALMVPPPGVIKP